MYLHEAQRISIVDRKVGIYDSDVGIYDSDVGIEDRKVAIVDREVVIDDRHDTAGSRTHIWSFVPTERIKRQARLGTGHEHLHQGADEAEFRLLAFDTASLCGGVSGCAEAIQFSGGVSWCARVRMGGKGAGSGGKSGEAPVAPCCRITKPKRE